jgi:hypothetical protein
MNLFVSKRPFKYRNGEHHARASHHFLHFLKPLREIGEGWKRRSMTPLKGFLRSIARSSSFPYGPDGRAALLWDGPSAPLPNGGAQAGFSQAVRDQSLGALFHAFRLFGSGLVSAVIPGYFLQHLSHKILSAKAPSLPDGLVVGIVVDRGGRRAAICSVRQKGDLGVCWQYVGQKERPESAAQANAGR